MQNRENNCRARKLTKLQKGKKMVGNPDDREPGRERWRDNEQHNSIRIFQYLMGAYREAEGHFIRH